jgi:glyoxylase-like metal-dependent hydrolase (beta-lactamase superfamily II)
MPIGDSSIFLIPIPTPFPVGPVNVYLLKEDPLTLIDAGPKHAASLTALENGLAQHGVRIEDIKRLILTHHHVDHVGLAQTIVQRSGASVITHPYNIPYLEDYEAERVRQLPFYAEIWSQAGTPSDIVESMRRSGEGMSRWLEPVTATHTIDEGDKVNMGGVEWTVYHTPGHAGGLVCFHNPITNELIANDHLLRDISSNPILEPPPTGGVANPRPKRLVEYIVHMQRMAALNPAIAYPGHGEPVDDVPALVRKRLAFHRRRADRIFAALAERPLTLWELTAPMFPKLTRGIDFFLAHSEVLGHIDILVDEGKVVAVEDGELIRWTVNQPV